MQNKNKLQPSDQKGSILHPLRISKPAKMKLTFQSLGSPFHDGLPSHPHSREKGNLPPFPECQVKSRTSGLVLSVKAHDLDRWLGLSTEPPRQPNKQLGIEILLLEEEEARKNLKGSLATGPQHFRLKNLGGEIKVQRPVVPAPTTRL